MLIVRYCKDADKEHKKSIRQYAHTNHYKNQACVSKAFKILPLEIQMALIAHEVGHLMLLSKGNYEHSEEDANNVANKFFGIRMNYRDFAAYGENLEVLSKKDTEKVEQWVSSNIVFKGL